MIKRALMCLCSLAFQESRKLKFPDSLFLPAHFLPPSSPDTTKVTVTLISVIEPILSLCRTGLRNVKSDGHKKSAPLHSHSHAQAHTWAPVHLHSSRRSRQTSRSESCNGAGHGTASRPRPPSACCKRSAAPFRSCTHCTGCRSCRLSLRGRSRHRSLDSRRKGRWKWVLQQGKHICTGVHLHGC